MRGSTVFVVAVVARRRTGEPLAHAVLNVRPRGVSVSGDQRTAPSRRSSARLAIFEVVNIPLDDWSGASATKRLHAEIVEQATNAKRRDRVLLRLTWAIALMTAALLVMTLVLVLR
jgi:hypothetical protein